MVGVSSFVSYIDKEGATQVALDEKMNAEENNKDLIGVLIKSLSESFENNYLKTMKILSENASEINHHPDKKDK